MSQPKTPVLVAHRGYSSRYPENTLPSIEAAIRVKASYVEFDIQMSRDRVPLLCHDATLLRTSGLNQPVLQMTASELDRVDVSEPQRLGSRFKRTPVPRLSKVLHLLAGHLAVHAFIEIKEESLEHFGVSTVMEPVMALVHAYASNCTIISFNLACLLRARNLGAKRIGLVTEREDTQTLDTLNDLRPDFLFTSDTCFSKLRTTFPGTWRWAVYHTENPTRAIELTQQGADLVETNAIGDMLDAFKGISDE
ncbi:MAG: glycerophosphodiester phosphodiesterase family protein [Gammaproteobacteria bacterium]